MRCKMLTAGALVGGLIFVLFASAQTAQAGTYTWDASGSSAPYDGSGTWNLSGSNWSGSGGTLGTWQDQQTDMAVFGANSGPAGTVTVSNYGNAIYSGSMTFNPAGSGTYLVTGDPIDLGGSSGTATIVVNASSGTIGSLLETYNNSLIMSGKGALYLTNAVYAGTTKISGSGELYLDCPAGTTAIAVTAGTLGGSGGASGAAVTVSTKAGIEAGSGGLGTLTLGGLNFNGTSAEIKISNVTNYAATPAIVVTNNNGLTADGGPGLDSFVLGGPAPSGSGTVELMQYTGTVGGSGTAAFGLNSGGLTGLSARAVLGLTTTSQGGYNYIDLTYKTDYPVWTGAGNGIWVTSPNLTVSGTTNWVSGLSPGVATNFLANDAVVFSDSATGTTNVSISGTGNVSPGSVTFNNNNLSYTLSTTAGYGIVGPASLTMNGSGSVTISNSNGYSGGTIVNAGRLNVANSAALGPPADPLTINGGTLDNLSGGPMTLANYPVNWNGNFTFGGSNPLNLGAGGVILGSSAAVTLVDPGAAGLTIVGPMSGANGFTQNGSGVLVLIGSSNYTGATNINGGTLSVGNGGSGASIGATSGVNLAAGATLLFSHSDSVTFAPPIGGSGSVVQSGGVLTLVNSNSSYSGGTFISGGTLRANGAGGLGPASGTLNVATGGLVDLSGASATIGALGGNGTIDNVLAGGVPTLTVGNGGGSGTFFGTIQNTTGAVSLVKTGSGVQTLSGANTFSGTTQIIGGTINVAAPLALQQSTVTVSVNNGLAFSASSATIGGLAGGGSVNLGSTNLTVGANGFSSLYSGSLNGAGGFTKTGSGTLTLTSAGSYSGATSISGGVLRVQQIISGPSTSLPVTAGLQYWLDASNAASVNSTIVNSWNDLSGNGYSFTVASGTTAPTLVFDALNGLPMVQFNGSTNVLINAATSNVDAQTVFIVTIPSKNQPGSLGGIWGNYGSDGGIRLGDVAGTWRGNPNSTGDNTDSNDFTYNGTTYITTAGSIDANTTNFGSPGTPQIIAATSAVGAAYATTGIGGYFEGAFTGRDYAGDIGEVLVYNGQLSTAQRQAVESYLDYKWLGTLTATVTGASNVLPVGTSLAISNGGSFDMTDGTQTIASLSSTDGLGSQVLLGGTGILTIAGSATTTFDGVISGTGGSLVKQGAGTLVFTGANTYAGNTTISAGTLQLGDGVSKVGSVTGNIVNNSAVVFVTPASQSQVYEGVVGGSGSLTKTGAGVLSLSNSQTYSGPTIISGGILRLNAATDATVSGFGTNTTGAGSNSTWTINTNNVATTAITNSVLTLTDGSQLEARSAFLDTRVAVNAPFTASFTYTPTAGTTNGFGLADGMCFVLQNSGATALGIDGDGLGYSGIAPSAAVEFNLYAAATNPGTDYTTAGTISSYNGTSPVNLDSHDSVRVTLAYDGSSILTESLMDLSTSATYSATYNVGNLAATVGGSSAYVGFTGASGGGDAVQTISDFSVEFGNAPNGNGSNLLPSTTPLTMTAGTLDLNGSSQTIASLAGAAGAVVLDSGTLTTGGDNTSTTFAGAITGTGALDKTGSGTFTLAGSSTLTGGVNVSAGVLQVDGALAAAVTVNSGGMLSGNGSVTSATIESGGTLSPGDAPQQALVLSGGLALVSGAKLAFTLDTPTDSDEIFMPTGTLSLSGQQFGDFTFTPLGGFGPGTYDLIDAGSISGSFGANTSGTVDGYPANIAVEGNEVVLNVVPEPGTVALLAAAVLCLAAFRGAKVGRKCKL